MGEVTKIAWTDATFNPWWGCQRVSPGCEHCYAETFSKRVGLKVWGPTNERRFFGDKHWAEPIKRNAAAARDGVRRRVFCASMADVFEDREDLVGPRHRLFGLISETPHLDWLLLTKRPQNMVRFAPASWKARWPSNVWAGTTAENQERADERLPWLVEVPAAVRFLSCEPLLGPVDLTNIHPYYLKRGEPSPYDPIVRLDVLRGHTKGPDEMTDMRVQWVIVGGESGHGARPFALEWASDLADQCRAAGVACFVKQMGDRPTLASGPIAFRASKGGDPDEWPESLRVRQFPEARA